MCDTVKCKKLIERFARYKISCLIFDVRFLVGMMKILYFIVRFGIYYIVSFTVALVLSLILSIHSFEMIIVMAFFSSILSYATFKIRECEKGILNKTLESETLDIDKELSRRL